MPLDAKVDLKLLRIDQVGSLVCPAGLEAAFRDQEQGRINDEELRQAQDEAIIATLATQERLGMPILTDGELRRRNFQDSFANAVSGFDVPRRVSYDLEASTQPLARAEQNFAALGPAILTRRPVVERLQLARNVSCEEYTFAAAHSKHPVKATVLSPDRIVQRFDYERSRHIYKDQDAFLADVVSISRRMVQDLVDAGCRYIQIDAPGYTAYVDQVSIDRMRARGEDPQVNLARSIEAENAVISGFTGVTFGIHICRGNARTRDPKTGKVVAQYHREGHYDAIAEQLFTRLNHDRWLLEYDSGRAGGFEPLRFLPKERVAVLGLITTKDSEIESTDILRRRIDEASKFLDLSQLALSPQCGFGGVGHVTLTIDEQWRKLERMLETARLVWG
jgi:5-methyltetrahydropteroyltriglutamate--homocysteine methyltransferase